MKILVIGGTKFVGKYIAEAAVACGHEVTLFHRGKASKPEDQPEVSHILGNRENQQDLAKLSEHEWDVVIDSSAYTPVTLAKTIQALKDHTKRYIFISTISVYKDYVIPGITEDYGLKTFPEDARAELESGQIDWMKYYGELKVLCEQKLNEEMPNRVLHIRPCIVIGPDDYSDRLTYWVKQIGQENQVLLPGSPDSTIQFVDVRDLGAWTIHMAEQAETGVYNACGHSFTRKEMFETIREVTKSKATFVWVDEEYLLNEGLNIGNEFPLWIPKAWEQVSSIFKVSNQQAVEKGFTERCFADSVGDIWKQIQEEPRELKVGMKSDQLKALITKYQQSKA